MEILLDTQTEKQINQCVNLLTDILEKDLLGMYLYGSAVIGGLQKYSDLDLFVVSNRSMTSAEKTKLATNLLAISGIYMQSTKRPIEMTIVVKSAVNPWRYPPQFDFQYGDWLRDEFTKGNIEPWKTNEMPDLALLITQVLLAHKTLWGKNPEQLLSKVPYKDVVLATIATLDELMANLNSDTRNVLLTLARIWCRLTTDQIRTKPQAVAWAISRLPQEYQSVMQRAKAICLGEENERWNDIKKLIQPCAQFIMIEINKRISLLDLSDNNGKFITYFNE